MKLSRAVSLSWVGLLAVLGGVGVALARQAPPRVAVPAIGGAPRDEVRGGFIAQDAPPRFDVPSLSDAPEDAGLIAAPFDDGGTTPAPPGAAEEPTADSFLERNRRLAERRLSELNEQVDRIRAQLEAVEAERAKWQAIHDAMAEVPARFHRLADSPVAPPPSPTGDSIPLPEPGLDMPPPGSLEDPPLDPSPSPYDREPGSSGPPVLRHPAPGPFDLPAPPPSAPDRPSPPDGSPSPFDLEAPPIL